MCYEQKSGDTAGFYKQNIISAKESKTLVPLKKDGRYKNVERYGGYSSLLNTYFALIECKKKNKKELKIVAVPLLYKEDLKSYLDKKYANKNYDEINIKKDKILSNTLFKWKGFPLFITGGTNNQLEFCRAVQLILCDDYEKYFKKIVKVKSKIDSEKKNRKTYTISEVHDEITAEKNKEFYRVLANKFNSKVYKNEIFLSEKSRNMFNDEIKVKFDNANLEDQVTFLFDFVTLLTCSKKSLNFQEFSGPREAGRIRPSENIPENTKLIYQSVTGLYEREIDLSEL
jgi:CRISPR-associated endonuclease Csn1